MPRFYRKYPQNPDHRNVFLENLSLSQRLLSLGPVKILIFSGFPIDAHFQSITFYKYTAHFQDIVFPDTAPCKSAPFPKTEVWKKPHQS
jgi:hypothetical protein